MGKNIILSIVVVGLIILGIGGFYLYNSTVNNQQNQQNSTLGTKGTVIFGIKDAASSMGSVSSVLVTTNQAQIHSQTEGWVTLSSQTQQFDLLQLKESGNIAMVAKADVKSGTYDQMRLNVSKVIVVENGAQKEAKLPSGDLKIISDVVVNDDKTATAVFDFIADESLHKTGNGLFIFTPVIKIETRSDANVQVTSGNEVTINGGKVEVNKSVGMDVNGEVKTNFKVDANAKVEIIGNVIKLITSEENSASVKVSANTAITTVISGKYLDVAISVRLEEQDGKRFWVVSGLKGIEFKNVMVSAETGAVVTVQ